MNTTHKSEPGSRIAGLLKSRLREVGDQHQDASRIRLHRAISWLQRAECEQADDLDAQFLFLWIAFNAAYAREFGFEQTERTQLQCYLSSLVAVDQEQRLHQLMFQVFTGPIRSLIDNKLVFEPFWRALRDHDSSGQCEVSFTSSQRVAMKCLLEHDTDTVLSIVFDRLYVLRNQLIHGGATWNSGVNRVQVRDGVRLLHAIVPVLIALMLEHPQLDLGEILFPVV